MAGIMIMTSAAYACVIFRGRMTVTGNRGATTVEGHGNAHAYCDPGGRPLTAAAGTANSELVIETGPGVACPTYEPTPGAVAPNVLPAGTYLIKFNQGEGNTNLGTTPTVKPSYTYDGLYWNMENLMGCFPAKNAGTSTDLGTMEVLPGGVGVGVVTLDPLFDSSAISQPNEAYNLCIGERSGTGPSDQFGGRHGLLAPFRLVSI